MHSVNLAASCVVFRIPKKLQSLFLSRIKKSSKNAFDKVGRFKFSSINKLLFNFKNGSWYSCKQRLVWDQDYFLRNSDRSVDSLKPVLKAEKFDVPTGILEFNSLPLIFGIAAKIDPEQAEESETVSLIFQPFCLR